MTSVALLDFTVAAGGFALAVAAARRMAAVLADGALGLGMAVLAGECLCTGFAALHPPLSAAALVWQRAGWSCAALIPGSWLLFSLSYARGDGRRFLARWKLVLVASVLLPAGVASFGWSHLVQSVQDDDGSFAVRLGWSGWTLNWLLMAGAVLILMNLERTYRAAVGTQRWRVKFLLLAVVLIFVIRIYTASQAVLFHRSDSSLAALNLAALALALGLILRARLRDDGRGLDVYPSHSVLHRSATVLLAGTYLLVVGVGAKVLSAIGGGARVELEAFFVLLALVAAVLLLQSDRLRLRLDQLIQRHFRRPGYDYRKVWSQFIDGAGSQLTQPDLCRALVKLSAQLFQALSVGIWLVDERRLALAASTFLSEDQGRELEPSENEVAELLAHWKHAPNPADAELAAGNWARLVRRMHPSEFPGRENRVCLPILTGGEVVGVMLLGDRVNGRPFAAEDFDMLRCVGDHAAANLANLRLAQKLLHARELEAFQTMAAFLVHDLKNAASTLGLTLKNLPVHFDDPVFREDALRGFGKSVTHINHVIGRLSLLRSGFSVSPRELDFNEVVDQVIASLEGAPQFTIRAELSPLPKLALDREQIAKVVTNLVLNAQEAMNGHGEIRISTWREQAWAVLAVGDSGCGMSEDFIQRSLYRPFQTTKRSGLGIGMFQSKMIVETHGGRIAVSSAPGSGTTFRVMLPVPGDGR